MARRALNVTYQPLDPDRLPEFTAEGTALVMLLAQRDMFELIAKRVRIRSQCGFTGVDVVVLLLYYFASEYHEGVRKFRKRIGPYHTRLAALARRDTPPSRSAIGRALEDVQTELIRPATEWLLSEAADIDVLLQHPCVQTTDARAERWHVFDYDPTMTVLRQRALPIGPDYPDPIRRSTQMQPGYGGRKREDVQLCRATLQHAGSSAWLFQAISSGNGMTHADFCDALGVAVRTCQRLGHPLSRALVRVDGAYGWVPFYWAARERGVALLTRLSRPEMFDEAHIIEAMRDGQWWMVPDSGSGPRRSAMELGMVTVPPGEQTKRPDGGDYEPITIRVVVCRYPRPQGASAACTSTAGSTRCSPPICLLTVGLRPMSSPATSAEPARRTGWRRRTERPASIASSATTCRGRSWRPPWGCWCGTCVWCRASRWIDRR